jgi:pimeloyl-ACP methyl ester carboxylesterase
MNNRMTELVNLDFDRVQLVGEICLFEGCIGAVIFAHGTGSSHSSPRNRFVAGRLNALGIGTLLFDLLTPREGEVYQARYDIDLLTQRLVQASAWFMGQPLARDLPLAYFGSTTGAAAALKAAAALGDRISAVVCRGGHPNLAGDELEEVISPTLLIVGEADRPVLSSNREAYLEIPAKKRLAIIPGASHLFEEPGALDSVAQLAGDWFVEFFRNGAAGRPPAPVP